MTTRATAIREAIIVRLSSLMEWGAVRRLPVPQVQPTAAPILSVFIVGERLQPDGQANVGEPRFISATTIAISVFRGFDETEVLDGLLDTEIDLIEQRLFSDPSFVGFGASSLFEAIESVNRTRSFPQEGETYFAMTRIEITFATRVSFPPLLDDDLEHIRITTRLAGSGLHTPSLSTDVDLTT